jgi:MraZ protein
MFKGEYSHSLDAKNRLIIPAKFREELGDTFVVTKYLDGALAVYTNDQWAKMMEMMGSIPMTNQNGRKLYRAFSSMAIDCEPDGQGRIQLTPKLIRAAEIVKKCSVVGVGDHVEIWAEEKWEAYSDISDEEFEQAAESLTEYLR